ncbi:methyltransferase domain-containing protein [Kribbella swartbergensis]
MRETADVADREPAFAGDAATAAYYERRAGEYDEWYLSQGRFAERNPPGWESEVARLVELIQRLPVARTLDVACGTGFLTRHLRGRTVGLDRSQAMLEVAQQRPGVESEQWLDRTLNDGSRHRIYKRYLTSAELAEEIGGQVLFDGRSFVAAAVSWSA